MTTLALSGPQFRTRTRPSYVSDLGLLSIAMREIRLCFGTTGTVAAKLAAALGKSQRA